MLIGSHVFIIRLLYCEGTVNMMSTKTIPRPYGHPASACKSKIGACVKGHLTVTRGGGKPTQASPRFRWFPSPPFHCGSVRVGAGGPRSARPLAAGAAVRWRVSERRIGNFHFLTLNLYHDGLGVGRSVAEHAYVLRTSACSVVSVISGKDQV